MKLTRVAGSDCQDGDTCPAKYHTDHHTTVYIGAVVTDPEALAQLAGRIGPGEAAFEVPDDIADAR